MKSGWEYIEENGIREKMAPNTLISNVLESENGPGLLDIIRNYTHPIGSIWMTLRNDDPNVLFGGTWTKIEDVFLLASGDDVQAGETGGESAHTLTTEELPSHQHPAKNHRKVYKNLVIKRLSAIFVIWPILIQ